MLNYAGVVTNHNILLLRLTKTQIRLSPSLETRRPEARQRPKTQNPGPLPSSLPCCLLALFFFTYYVLLIKSPTNQLTTKKRPFAFTFGIFSFLEIQGN